MFLYLVRHGEARSEQEDPERHLTDYGRVEVERMAWHAAYRWRVKVQHIFHSGKTRARETAEILGKYLSPTCGVSPVDGLEPDADAAIWSKRVSQYDQDIMLVGHLPHLGRLASGLVCGNLSSEIIDFQRAAILCLLRGSMGWVIHGFMTPEMI